ncbi:MAG TPA: manganese efflux pump MntP family protein [Myxococcota bacterium]|nr:manganese efflux pump MntP family protein [Myxococcota bacterium]
MIEAWATLLLTAVAVAMDAVAVSICSGMARGRATWGESLRMGTAFGLFQAAMPALGYAGGALFRGALEAYDHWVAFALLAGVGLHMMRESRRAAAPCPPDAFGVRRLLALGLATSIDALAVGLTLALIEVPFALAVAVIGATTFALCVPAVHMGARLGARFARRAEFAGGAVLVALGAKILVEHLSGAG